MKIQQKAQALLNQIEAHRSSKEIQVNMADIIKVQGGNAQEFNVSEYQPVIKMLDEENNPTSIVSIVAQ